jgi:Tol biopolymer transport system component
MSMDVFVFDLAQGNLTRLTTEGRNATPVWTPDGTRLAYRSTPGAGADNLFWQRADGGSAPERLSTSPHNHVPATFTPDGQGLIFFELQQRTDMRGSDVWFLPLEGPRTARPLLGSNFATPGVDVSPDGRWLAYASTESDRPEVFVRPYDRPSPRRKVSIDGGMTPVWRRDGRELFFMVPPDRNGRIRMMATPVTADAELSIGTPRPLFEDNYLAVFPGRSFDVTADGQRFLMIHQNEVPPVRIMQIVVVQNWFEELKRLVPIK